MSELTIREMGQDEDFSAWFSELLDQEERHDRLGRAPSTSITSF